MAQPDNTVVIGACIDRIAAAKLAELARAGDRSVSGELRHALREHLEREAAEAAREETR